MNKHFENFAKSGITIEAEIDFVSTKDLTSLAQYHHDGGKLFEGMPVILERNARTKHIPAVLVSYKIGSVPCDLTGYGKYAESSVIVEFDGQQHSWAFSMVYLTKE